MRENLEFLHLKLEITLKQNILHPTYFAIEIDRFRVDEGLDGVDDALQPVLILWKCFRIFGRKLSDLSLVFLGVFTEKQGFVLASHWVRMQHWSI